MNCLKISKWLFLLITYNIGSTDVLSLDVKIKNGIIKFEDYNNCSIMLDNENVKLLENGYVPRIHFGLVKYNCDNIVGFKISKLKCNDCGIFCMENQLIEGCESYYFLLLIGILIGCIGTPILYFSLKKILPNIYIIIFIWINKKLQDANDRKHEQQVEKLRKMGIDAEHNYQDKYFLDFKSKTFIHQKRNKTRQNSSNVSKNIVRALAVSSYSLNTTVEGCDKTLFLSSTGKICSQLDCQTGEVLNLGLVTGNQICLTNTNGENFQISLKNSYVKHYYGFSYYTSLFKTRVDYISQCKSAGLCWNGYCYPGAYTSELLEKPNGTIHFYGCDTNTLGCDTWCYHQTSCAWYKWSANTEGELIKVFVKTHDYWEIDLLVTFRNISKVYVLNVNSPFINLNNFGSQYGTVPIFVTSVQNENKPLHRHFLSINNKYYNVPCSEVNMPVLGTLGEYQVDRLGTHIYPISHVKCQVSSCKVYCRLEEPSLSRFVQNIDNYADLEMLASKDEDLIIYKQKVNSVANIMINFDNFNALQYVPAKCHFNVLNTFACKGCDKLPRVILMAKKIIQGGIIPIETNCKTKTKFLPCNPEPFSVELESFAEFCEIYMPLTNQTLGINFTYVYTGKLTNIKVFSADTYSWDDYGQIFFSQGMIDGIIRSMTIFSSLGIAIQIFFKMLNVYQLKRVDRNINNPTVEE